MEKSEIVKKFMERGYLLSPAALEKVDETNINRLLEKTYDNLVLCENDFVLEKKQENYFKILKNLSVKPDSINIGDVSNLYIDKYKKMSKIIRMRVQKNFISINKMMSGQKGNVIGIIKDIKPQNNGYELTIEDITGIIIATAQNLSEALVNDVAAFSIDENSNCEILWPDVPIRTSVKGFGKICFISDLHLNEIDKKSHEQLYEWLYKNRFDFVLVAGDIGDVDDFKKNVSNIQTQFIIISDPHKTKDNYPNTGGGTEGNLIWLSNPSMVEINGIVILIIHEFDKTMLKKRYLGCSHEILPEDFLVLDIIPDIVHYGHTHQPFIEHYKSISILNSGSLLEEFRPVILNLETREIEFGKIS